MRFESDESRIDCLVEYNTVYTVKVKPKRALERSKSSRRYRLSSPPTRVKATPHTVLCWSLNPVLVLGKIARIRNGVALGLRAVIK